MKHKFLLGAVAGAGALIAAVPLVAQLSSAQGASPASSTPVPSQTCIQALVAKDGALLANVPAHEAALQAAVTAADIQTANNALASALQGSLNAANAACGDLKGLEMGWEGDKGHENENDANDPNEREGQAEVQDKNDGNEGNEQPRQSDQNEQDEGAPTSAATSAASSQR